MALSGRLALSAWLAAGVLSHGAAFAAQSGEMEPFRLDAAVLLAEAAVPAPRDAFPAVTLLNSQRYVLDDRHRVTHTSHQIVRIDSPAAVVEFGQVTTIWDPSRQDRPRVRARVVTTDGREHAFDAATFAEGPVDATDPRIFDDFLTMRAPLPAVAVGSVLEIEVVIIDREPYFEAGLTKHFIIGPGSTERLQVVVDAPSAMPLRYTTRLMPQGRLTQSVNNGRRRVTFDHGPIELEFEDLLSEAMGDQPVMPEFVFSTGESWAAVAAAYGQLAMPLVRPDEVATLVPPNLPEERDRRVDALLAVLNEKVRYTGVLFGQGKIVPNPPGVTFQRRFGDCKDKAVALASLLEAAGVTAQLVLLNADAGVNLDPELPGIGSFNHMIVRVPGEPVLWIDPTAELLRSGQLPFADAGRWSLLIGERDDPLQRTPEPVPADRHSNESRIYRLADFGKADVTVTAQLNGEGAMILRQFDAYGNKAANKKLQDSLGRFYEAESVSALEFHDEPETGYLTLRLDLAGASGTYTDFGAARVGIRTEQYFEGIPFGLRSSDQAADLRMPAVEDRTADWVFAPYLSELHVKIVPPAGFAPRQPPEDVDRHFGPLRYRRHFSMQADGSVDGFVSVDSGKGRYSPTEGRAFRAAWLQDSGSVDVDLRFEHEASALLAAGDAAGALRRHRELIAAAPEAAIHQQRAAAHLVQLGFRDEAAQAARKATLLDPASSIAWTIYAWVLEHDEVGRRFGPGFDRDAAIDARRKALELDPDEAMKYRLLAEVAVRNGQGESFAPGSDIELSIATLRSYLGRNGDDRDVNRDLLTSLWYQRRFDEVAAIAAKLTDDEEAAAIRLAARAMLVGPAVALREDASRSDATSHAKHAERAAALMRHTREYEQARALVASASLEGRMQSETGWVQATARARRSEDLPPPPATAAGAAESIMRLLLRAQPDATRISGWLSKRARIDGSNQWLVDALVGYGRQAFGAGLRQFGISSALIQDVLQSNVEYAETALAGGARRITAQLGGRAVASLYVVPEERQWRVLTAAPQWHPAAREVIVLLDAGDTVGARAWLEALREDFERDQSNAADEPSMFERALPVDAPDETAAMRAAAYVLMARHPSPAIRLDEVRDVAPQMPADDQRIVWLAVLVAAALAEDDAEAAITAAEQMRAAAPASEDAFGHLMRAYQKAGRWTDMERAARDRLTGRPQDAAAQRWLTDALNQQGRAREALEALALLVRRGRADSSQLNNYAWQALVADAVDEPVIAAAENAFRQTQGRAFGIAHTLACLYAVTGRTADAQRVFLLALEAASVELDDDNIWLLQALMAEGAGLTAPAIRAYRRIEESKDLQFDSSMNHQIAATRRQRLVAAPAGAADASLWISSTLAPLFP